MGNWYFLVTNEDGTKYEDGPHATEEVANVAGSLCAEEYPDKTIGAAIEHAEGCQPLAAKAHIFKDDGSKDVLYNDGTVVNVS